MGGRGGGQILTCFFVSFVFKLMRGEGIQLPLKAGHHRPTKETPFKWRFAGVPMIVQR